MTLGSTRGVRVSTKRPKIWTITPRCFFATDSAGMGVGAELRAIGGDIFSNVKAGMVCPLIVELKHSWISARILFLNGV
jgi:hypothetical protein